MIGLKRVGYVILVILALFIFIGTPWGTHIILGVAKGQVEGLEIERRSGGFWGTLDLAKLSWKSEGIDLDLTDVQLEMDWHCSLAFSVCVDSLVVRGVNVQVATQTPTEDKAPSNEKIQLPIPVSVNQLSVKNLQMNIQDVAQIRWVSMDTKLNMLNQLNITHLTLKNLNVILPAPPTDTNSGSQEQAIDFASIAAWQYEPVPLPSVFIPIDAKITKLTISDLVIEQPPETIQRIKSIALVAKVIDSKVTIDELNVAMLDAVLNAKGQFTPDYDVQLTASWKSNPAVKPLIDGQLEVSGDPSKLNISASVAGQYNAEVNAWVDITTSQLPVSINARWQSISIPSETQLTVDAGKLAVQGDMQAYQLQVSSGISGATVPKVDVVINASGNHRQAQLSKTQINTLGGQVLINGQYIIDSALNFQAGVTLSEIQPEQHWPEYSGDINGDLRVNGTLTKEQFIANLSQMQLNGNWLGYDLIANGALSYDSNVGLDVPNIALTNGNNKLTVAGKVDNQQIMDFQVSLNANDLSQLYPDLMGKTQLTATTTGPVTAPSVTFQLDGTDLRYAGASLSQLTSSGSLVWDEDKPVDIQFVATTLTSSEAVIDELSVELAGNALAHTIITTVRSNVMNIDSTIAGSLNDTHWQGNWQQGQFGSQWGSYQLQSDPDISIDWGKQVYEISAHCWKDSNAALCVKQAWMADNWVKFDIEGEQLELLQIVGAFVPQIQSISSDTRLFFDAKGDWSLDASPEAKIVGRLTPSNIKLAGFPKPLEMQKMAFQVEIDSQNLTTQIDLVTKHSGKVLIAGSVKEYANQGDLDIDLQINEFLLRPYQQLVPPLSELSGEINGKLNITGNIGRPLFMGRLKVSDVNLAGEALPGRVDNWQQDIEFGGESATFKGEFGFGNGRGQSSGDVDWSSELIGSMSLKGNQFELEYRDTVRANFSPDVRVSLKKDTIEVGGKVDVDYARIKVKELPPDAQTPSDDVVLINEPTSTETPARPINLHVQINIDPSKSNNVKLDAFGLKTDLQGALELKQSVGKLSGLGELRLVNGKYKAYGQDLIIQKGNIMFSGPLESPNIDIVAIRDPAKTQDGVTAGIKVFGQAEQPSVDIYSEPPMSQSRALSYLVQGKDLGGNGQSQSSDEQMLASVLLSAGLQSGENRVDRLGRSLGIEDLALGAEDGSKVALSGYIAPGVQLKYGVNVFDSSSEVTLRYQLLPQLYLEAISGAESSLEVLYQFTLGKRITATSEDKQNSQ